MPDYPLGLQGRPFPYHVKTTADHWWPKGLQRLWVDQDGYVSLINPYGEVKSAKPPQKGSSKTGFAHKRGGHKLQFGVSPWNHTFEPDFEKIDNAGPPILKHIAKQLEGGDEVLFGPSEVERTTNTLIKLCFSLMVRSPAFRYLYSRSGESFGLGYNEETGKANIQQFWSFASQIDLKKCNSGNLLLLHAENSEFCFGDGLCDTIFSRPVSWRPQGMHWVADLIGDAFIPLLPNVCAYLYFLRGGFGSKIQLFPVTSNIVKEVNTLTQIYSKEQLFFRAVCPTLTPEYRRREHLMVSTGQIPLIEMLRTRVS
ncbi:hypothetical protein [Roseicyclus marinus]|uniref:hypothetical protein n=1 Tax=Roseicyclus marinus TaxID=2161673 RepID=UPI0030C68D4B